MIFTTYNQTDTYYEFIGENGQKLIYPVSSIILTDDESGFIAVKNTASRQTIGLLAKPIPRIKHVIYDSATATKGYPAVLTSGNGSNGRFNDSEGTYFNRIADEVYDYLADNNVPLMVEFSQVNETQTISIRDGWWNTFYASLPISTEEPLEIPITSDMLTRLKRQNLMLFNPYDITTNIIVTSVYYYE